MRKKSLRAIRTRVAGSRFSVGGAWPGSNMNVGVIHGDAPT